MKGHTDKRAFKRKELEHELRYESTSPRRFSATHEAKVPFTRIDQFKAMVPQHLRSWQKESKSWHVVLGALRTEQVNSLKFLGIKFTPLENK